MPEALPEIYSIKLELKAEWSKVLAKATADFESHVEKAFSSARKLETSLSSMNDAVAKSSENLLKNSQRQIQGITNFANTSIKMISTSATNILASAEKRQAQHVKFVERNIKRIVDMEKKAGILSVDIDKMTEGGTKAGKGKDYETAINKRAQIYENIELIKDAMKKVGVHHSREMSRLLSQHFAIVSKGMERKVIAVSKTTDILVDNTLKKFKMLRSQAGLMGEVGGTVHMAQGVKMMESEQSKVFANLKNLREAQANAEQMYANQRKQLERSTNSEIRKWHQETLTAIGRHLENIKGKYLETAKGAQRLTNEIREQKQALATKGTNLYQSMRDELKPSRITSLFERIFANVRETAATAGRGMSNAMVASMEKGDKLNATLDRFKERLVEIKSEAKRLSDAGLIDPRKIRPKIEAAENLIMNFSGQLKKLQRDMSTFSPKGMKEFKVVELKDVNRTRNELNQLAQDLKNSGKITSKNFEDLHREYTKAQSLIEEHLKYRRTAARKIEAIEAEASRVQMQIRKVNDADMRRSMVNYVRNLEEKADTLRKIMSKPITLKSSDLDRMGKEFEGAVKRVVARIRSTLGDADIAPTKMISKFKTQYKEVIDLVESAGRKRFFRKESIMDAEQAVEKLTERVRSYKDLIRTLEAELKRLQAMQRRGFRDAGIRQATVDLKENIQGLKSYVSEINSMHGHALKRMRDVSKQSSKSILRSGWEMIRNFRWQVAAIIYLIQRAVMGVKRVFMDTMGEVAKFRRDAMALAAQYSFKMFGDMRKNFNDAYKFSRNLLMKLEIVAAETILTLEDMMMLTKTFAQAGIIPKTDEDLNRIATIGTAIKALTEGMANAGVQMKQELYAIIAGRQRATDQLAMMFKLMGKDIQAMIDEGKKGGEDMIKVLADALKPFATMNEKLKMEWEAIINKLQIVWKMIKRIGLEPFLLDVTKQISDLIDQFWTKSEGLTEKGRMAAASIRAVFEVMRQIVSVIWEQVLSILRSVGMILQMVAQLTGLTTVVNSNISETSAKMQGILGTVEALMKAIWLINGMLRAITTTIELILSYVNYVIEAVKSLGAYLGGYFLSVLSLIPGKFGEAAGEAAKLQKEAGANLINAAYERMGKAEKAWFGQIEKNNEEYNQIEQTMKDIIGLLDKMKKGAAGIGEAFELTYPTGIFDAWAKMQNEMQRAEAAQYKGPKRFKVEYDQATAGLDDLKMKLNKNFQDFNKMEKKYTEGVIKMTDTQRKEFLKSWNAHKEIAGDVHKYETYLLNELNRKTAEWNRKEEIALARRKRKYEQFMREALTVDLTPKEKAMDWMEKAKIDLKELAVESEFFKDNYEEVLKAIEKGGALRMTEAARQMNAEYDKWIAKASKAGAWNNVYDEINIEFAEYVRQIEKSNTIDKERIPALKEQLDIIKLQREEQERLNLIHDAYIAQLDVQLKKADIMKGSYSPIKQAEGEIMSLQATHNKEMEDMRKKLEDFNNRWKENGQWVEKADDNVKAIGASYEETMRLMTEATEREIRKKQMPIWNDLIEASKTWADGFTDSLSQIVNGMDSVTEALQNLQMQILQDVVKTIIKRSITDQLMDALGSGEGSPLSGLFGMFPGGKIAGKEGAKMPQEITASKPIPVMVVNAGALGGTGIAAEGMTGMSDWMGDMTDWFSSIGSSSTAGMGAMDWAGSYGMGLGYAGYGFAEGGRITEPIIGRGLKSGEVYNFGEKTKYGEDEIIAPVKRMQKFSPSNKVEYHMPIHISSIDTQSGVEFLMKHSDTIQGQMVKNLKHNKPIRKGIQNAY